MKLLGCLTSAHEAQELQLPTIYVVQEGRRLPANIEYVSSWFVRSAELLRKLFRQLLEIPIVLFSSCLLGE